MVTLASGGARLVLAPETGGAVARWEIDGRPVLRPVSDPALTAQHGAFLGAYPLIPFSNRVAWGRFAFENRAYQLARNFGDHPHTIHGNAWMHPWRVARAEPDRARLEFAHLPPGEGDPAEWPFAYHAAIDYVLAPDRLEVAIAVTNRDARRQPVGLGFHPYFHRWPGGTLRFAAGSVWRTGADSLPDARLPASGAWSFEPARPLDAVRIDNCFAGWDGTATLDGSGADRISVSAGAPFGHLVVYVPDGQDFVAVEPASNMTDAVNHPELPDQGLVALEPGATLTGRVTIAVAPPATD